MGFESTCQAKTSIRVHADSMQEHNSGKAREENWKQCILKQMVMDFLRQMITEAEFNALLLIQAPFFVVAIVFANMTPREGQDKC